MAPNLPAGRCVFSLLSCLILILIVITSLAPVSVGRSFILDLNSNSAAKTVSLDLYYETLCPDSADFIINELANIFENGLIDIVDLKLFPWGNAKIGPNNTIHCQHGPNECSLNTIEACAIDVWPNVNEHFPFINCVENLVMKRKYKQWETCFEELGLDPKPVKDCNSSGYGDKLELKYAKETASLQPPHTYVPWVVVDGQPIYEDYENLTSYICKAYKGPKPSACSEVSFVNVLKEIKGDLDHVHPRLLHKGDFDGDGFVSEYSIFYKVMDASDDSLPCGEVNTVMM